MASVFLEPGPLFAGVALLVVLLSVSALAAAAETALFGLTRVRRRQLVDEKHPRILGVERLLDRPARLMATFLVVQTLAVVGASTLVAVAALDAFGAWGVAAGAALLFAALVATAGAVPRAFAASHAERVALALAPWVRLMQAALAPFVRVVESLAAAVYRRRTGRDATGEARIRSEDEIKTLITMGTEQGILEEKEEDMIHSVIEFAETTAKEIMVPRLDMTAVSADATLDSVRAYVLDSGFSRIPVYQGNVDNVVGILYVKDFLLLLLDRKGGQQVKEIVREPYFVPETKKLDALLQDMREKRVHMAIVVDEFGGTAGMLTLEDVLEEIVGDIFDEYDLRQDPVRKVDEQTAIVDARTHVADVNDALDIEIPEDEGYDTVAGYIYHALGRLGREGEVVHGPGFDVLVEKVTNRRILRARFVKHAPPEPEPGTTEPEAEAG
ncbi:MAG TPA: hemolysin family protein [Candidatus Thermoplasmatota archaeon]|nr:hemolysin family protein [Candidatus Thermoplasmatota archaeon]